MFLPTPPLRWLRRTLQRDKDNVYFHRCSYYSIVVIVSLLIRLVLRPLWNPYRLRRPYFGPYGYYGYGMGYRRHWFPGRGLLSILLLVTMERLFGRRW